MLQNSTVSLYKTIKYCSKKNVLSMNLNITYLFTCFVIFKCLKNILEKNTVMKHSFSQKDTVLVTISYPGFFKT